MPNHYIEIPPAPSVLAWDTEESPVGLNSAAAFEIAKFDLNETIRCGANEHSWHAETTKGTAS